MKEISKSGNRIYIFESIDVIPNITELINFPDQCKVFIDSVTLNPKNVNAQLYSQFSEETYHVFIYAFAFKLRELRPTSCLSKPFEMNARRVERLCRKRNIALSIVETKVIDYCTSFSLSRPYFKAQVSFSEQICTELRESYL